MATFCKYNCNGNYQHRQTSATDVPKHHATITTFFLKNNRSGNIVGQDWELQLTDMRKQHFEE
jgi:hypothetical protein